MRRPRLSTALLIAFLAASCGASHGVAIQSPRGPIEGTFIQYQDWMMELAKSDWNRELDAMREAGIRVVVIQWLQYGRSSFFPAGRHAVDPTETILRYADAHDMRVFVGLSHADLWQRRLRERGYLDRATTETARVANEAWQRYRRHPSFAGWYLSQELRDANYDYDETSRLAAFLKRLSEHCHRLSGGKPVAISAALMGLIQPEAFGRAYASLLGGSGIDILILQDGVGARGWDEGLETRIVPYYRVMQQVCRNARVELWGDIEIFQKGREGAARLPAPLARIKRQLAAEAPFVTSFVMFDFFHHMSPYRGELQKSLHDGYLRELVRSEPER